jgi:hypothetical protein
MSVAGAFANAPPIIAKDTPAAAHTGKAVFERFRLNPCFAFAIAEPLYQNSTDEPARHIACTLQPSTNPSHRATYRNDRERMDFASACALRVWRHHERRCSGMHFTVEVPEVKLPKLLSKGFSGKRSELLTRDGQFPAPDQRIPLSRRDAQLLCATRSGNVGGDFGPDNRRGGVLECGRLT